MVVIVEAEPIIIFHQEESDTMATSTQKSVIATETLERQQNLTPTPIHFLVINHPSRAPAGATPTANEPPNAQHCHTAKDSDSHSS